MNNVTNSTDRTTLAYLRLVADKNFGAKLLSVLLTHFGSLSQVMGRSPGELQQVGLTGGQCDKLLGVDSLDALDTEATAAALAWQNHQNRKIVLLESPAYPYLLKQIAVPPPLLFCHGDTSLLDQPACAIVGSRNATHYGKRQANWFGTELAAKGFVIVSGLARGIDTVAHRAALNNGDRTIGVIGTGIDIVYPASNRALHVAIRERGLLITEFLPGMPPRAMNFPRRNRILSGISLATVVIEASLRSGSLITARMAMEQNRNVFAIPGPIDSELSAGCHRLLRDGAGFAQSPDDVCAELIDAWNFGNQESRSPAEQDDQPQKQPSTGQESDQHRA